MENNTGKNWKLGAWIIIAIGLFLRFSALLKNPSLWFDESALAYNVATLKYSQLFGVLHLQQVAPPMFLALSKWVVSVFGLGDIQLRVIPFVFSCGSLIAFYFVLKSVFEKPAVVIIGLLLFAVNPRLLYFTTEFKPYMLDVFFALAIFYCFINMDLAKDSLKKILSIGVFLALCPWFSFASVIVAAVGFVTLILSQGNYKKVGILVLPSVLSYGLFLIYYIYVSSAYKLFMLGYFANNFHHFNIPLNFFFNTEIIVVLIVLNLALIAGIIFFMMEKKKFEITMILWIYLTVVLLSNMHLYPLFERFVLFLMPFVFLIILMCINVLLDKKTLQSRIVLVILMLALVPISMIQKDSDSRELTAYMVKNVIPSDTIVVNNLALPDFLYYTFNIPMKNKIITAFDKKDGRLQYIMSREFFIPEVNVGEFWLYLSFTRNVSHVIYKKDDIEMFEGYKVLKSKITPNGAVMYLSK